jgi:glutamyl-tRNA reductase
MNSLFRAVRISYAKAPSDIRESLSLDETASRKLHTYLNKKVGLTNVLVLSTTTFIEVYYCASADLKPIIINALVKQQQITSQENISMLADESYTITTTSDQTVQHLFSVSATPESMGPGGDNMYKLLKKAYEISLQEKVAGSNLRRIMQTILLLRGIRWN